MKICQLYYEQQVSQKQIAEQLGISRSQISRGLSWAKEEGLVSIQIHNPYVSEMQFEASIKEKFGLMSATVVDTSGCLKWHISDKIGQVASKRMNQIMVGRKTIGIMSGESIASIVKYMPVSDKKQLQFVPLSGSMGSSSGGWHANFLTETLAMKTGGNAYILNAPLIFQNLEARMMAEQQKDIAQVLALTEHCHIMLVGIGQINENATMVKSGATTNEDMALLQQSGAYTAMCAFFMNAQGEDVHNQVTQRFLGLKRDGMKKCPHVVAVAFGDDKIESIQVALQSGLIHEFMTDLETAKQLAPHTLH